MKFQQPSGNNVKDTGINKKYKKRNNYFKWTGIVKNEKMYIFTERKVMSIIAEYYKLYLTYLSSAGIPVNISEVCYCSLIECRGVSNAPKFTEFILCQREINFEPSCEYTFLHFDEILFLFI